MHIDDFAGVGLQAVIRHQISGSVLSHCLPVGAAFQHLSIELGAAKFTAINADNPAFTVSCLTDFKGRIKCYNGFKKKLKLRSRNVGILR